MRNTIHLPVLAAVVALTGVGCATTQQYGFRPTEMVASQEGGYPASKYAVPADAPRGEVYVTSFGTREIDAGSDRSHLVHVRMAVANQSSDAVWSVDPAQQQLVAPGGGAQPPSFMEIDGRRGNEVTIAKGQRRVFDFYYPLPGGARDASNVAGFEFNWQVVTDGGRLYAQRTPFAREAYRDYWADGRTNAYVGVHMGPPWWAYWYGPPWGYYSWYGGWPYYGPYVGFGYYHRPYWRGGYYGGGYYGGGYYGGGSRAAPPMRSGGGFGGGGFRGVSPGGGMGGGFRGGGGSAPSMRGRP